MKEPLGTHGSVAQSVTQPGRTRGWQGKLTEARVRTAKPTGKPYTLSDGHGLRLLIRPTGARVWFLVYRPVGQKKQQKVKLGDFPVLSLAAARSLALDHLAMVARGGDPAKDRRKAKVVTKQIETTFGIVLGTYIHQHVEKLRSAYDVRAVLEREFESRWKDRPITSITRQDVRLVIGEIKERAPIAARNAFAHLRAFFHWCLEEEKIAVSPMAGMKAPPASPSRDRVLAATELRAIWEAIDHLYPRYRGNGEVLRLLMLTGARRSEISDLEWREVDIEGRRLVLPRERMKAGEQHIIPLSDQALALVMAQPREDDRVFPSVNHWSRTKAGLDELLPDLPHWTIHDIRRTVASGLQEQGILPAVIERVLGHSPGGERGGGIRKVYQRYRYDREAREALQQWADHVERLLAGKSATVIGLRR